MGELLAPAWAGARKDLVLEFRTRTGLVSAIVFTALVLTVFNFGRDPTAVPTIDLAPTILWVTFTFAAMLALNRAFQLELENQALEGLLVSPLSRTSLYWGKLIANLVFVAWWRRSEEHTSELQSPCNLVCRLLLEKKKQDIA